MTVNAHGQPIGDPVADWTPPPIPPRTVMEGRFCRLEPLDAERHAERLWEAFSQETTGALWTYLGVEPFESLAAYRAWAQEASRSADPLFYAICRVSDGAPVGTGSLMRIEPKNGVIEIGWLAYSPLLQKTPVATEAIYLWLDFVFSLGYRRCEWKCDSLNAASRAAAERLGFRYEGTFRQAVVYKGRNRDTAWFSILDSEWPALKSGYERWLAPANFDADGKQVRRLGKFIRQE